MEVEVRKYCSISEFLMLSPNYLRFTKEEAETQKQPLIFVPARYILVLGAFSEHERHPYGVSKLF